MNFNFIFSNSSSTSSSSSSSSNSIDDVYDHMVRDFIEENHLLQIKEDATRHYVNNEVQQNSGKAQRKRRVTVPRDREGAHNNLMADYFCDEPLYNESTFRRRFRIRKHVFLRILNKLNSNYRYFQQHPDAALRIGASPYQKCTIAIKMLAYGWSVDEVDEYLKIGASTARECLAAFVNGVIAQFSAEYLHKPTLEDVQRFLREGEDKDFPGMLGSIDCMHWVWKNCPAGWKGMYQGRSKTTTVILEVIASRDLWIWHAFFGTPGSCNDINVLQRSLVFDDIINNRAPQVQFTVNENTYNKGYYLTDGIYPKWTTFIDAITTPQTCK